MAIENSTGEVEMLGVESLKNYQILGLVLIDSSIRIVFLSCCTNLVHDMFYHVRNEHRRIANTPLNLNNSTSEPEI